MSHRTTIDEDDESPISSSTVLTNNQRGSQTRLLTKIYYPDTLYPDNYSFFADRADTSVPPVRSSSPMDPSHQYPTTESASPPVIVSPLSRQGTTEIEIIDRPNKYVVSQAGFFLFPHFLSMNICIEMNVRCKVNFVFDIHLSIRKQKCYTSIMRACHKAIQCRSRQLGSKKAIPLSNQGTRNCITDSLLVAIFYRNQIQPYDIYDSLSLSFCELIKICLKGF